MKDYTVYMHISPSNKRYIGITSQEPNRRWQNGYGYKKNQYFYRAIEKHGWDNFQHIIICKGLTEDEAKWLEIELIREWDSSNRNKGYNISLGGESWNHSEETKNKISKAHKGKKHTEEARKKMSETRSGKKHTEEHRKKIGEARKGKYCGENSPIYGRSHTEEARKKMSENHSDVSGKNNSNAKLYKVIFLDGTEKIMCGNEIYNNNSSIGFLNISKAPFKKYIEPFGIIDINNIPQSTKSKKLKEKLLPFNGIKIIKY